MEKGGKRRKRQMKKYCLREESAQCFRKSLPLEGLILSVPEKFAAKTTPSY